MTDFNPTKLTTVKTVGVPHPKNRIFGFSGGCGMPATEKKFVKKIFGVKAPFK